MPIDSSSKHGFRKFTAADLPPDYDAVASKDAIPRISENRPRSLQNKFIATFYPDGQLELYACLVENLNSEGCALHLEHGIEKGTSSMGGMTAFYEAGMWFDVANGHEDRVDPETDTEEDWSSWVMRAIAEFTVRAWNTCGRIDRGGERYPSMAWFMQLYAVDFKFLERLRRPRSPDARKDPDLSAEVQKILEKSASDVEWFFAAYSDKIEQGYPTPDQAIEQLLSGVPLSAPPDFKQVYGIIFSYICRYYGEAMGNSYFEQYGSKFQDAVDAAIQQAGISKALLNLNWITNRGPWIDIPYPYSESAFGIGYLTPDEISQALTAFSKGDFTGLTDARIQGAIAEIRGWLTQAHSKGNGLIFFTTS